MRGKVEKWVKGLGSTEGGMEEGGNEVTEELGSKKGKGGGANR